MKKSIIYGLTVLVVAVLGCSSLSDGADSKVVQAQEPADCLEGDEECDPGTVETVECLDLGPEECGAVEGCMAIAGRQLLEYNCDYDDPICWSNMEGEGHGPVSCAEHYRFVACEDIRSESAEGDLYARNASGELWLFVDGFAPSGWEIEDYPVSPFGFYDYGYPESEECKQMGFDECMEQAQDIDAPCRPIFGWRVNDIDNCTDERAFVECAAAVMTMDGAFFFARDPQGDFWQIGGSRTPGGWPVQMLCYALEPCGWEVPEYEEYVPENPEDKQ
ncbi:MAG: hypothetical protein FWD57_13960 [Polyangiaceae bacterium]|nr:hypothetical protein [Polyangiaceae bacterium]